MADGSDETVQRIPAHLIEDAREAERDLSMATTELDAAKNQHKQSKIHHEKCQIRFNEASRAMIDVEKIDGFPPETPLGDTVTADDLADTDTPPDEDADGWEEDA